MTVKFFSRLNTFIAIFIVLFIRIKAEINDDKINGSKNNLISLIQSQSKRRLETETSKKILSNVLSIPLIKTNDKMVNFLNILLKKSFSWEKKCLDIKKSFFSEESQIIKKKFEVFCLKGIKTVREIKAEFNQFLSNKFQNKLNFVKDLSKELNRNFALIRRRELIALKNELPKKSPEKNKKIKAMIKFFRNLAKKDKQFQKEYFEETLSLIKDFKSEIKEFFRELTIDINKVFTQFFKNRAKSKFTNESRFISNLKKEVKQIHKLNNFDADYWLQKLLSIKKKFTETTRYIKEDQSDELEYKITDFKEGSEENE